MRGQRGDPIIKTWRELRRKATFYGFQWSQNRPDMTLKGVRQGYILHMSLTLLCPSYLLLEIPIDKSNWSQSVLEFTDLVYTSSPPVAYSRVKKSGVHLEEQTGIQHIIRFRAWVLNLKQYFSQIICWEIVDCHLINWDTQYR